MSAQLSSPLFAKIVVEFSKYILIFIFFNIFFNFLMY
jgi:hypothetical protein